MCAAKARSLFVIEFQRFFLDRLKEVIQGDWFHTGSCHLPIRRSDQTVMMAVAMLSKCFL
jgi:hypothetical protein